MSEPQIAAILVRKMVDHLVDFGVDRAALLDRAGVPAEALKLTRLRLPWALVEELIEAAAALSGDDRLGFHFARQHDLETLGLPGMLFFASRDVGVAIRRLTRAARLWSDAYTMSLEEGALETGAPARYRFVLHRPERPALAHLRENHLAGLTLAMDHLIGRRPLAILLPHRRDGDVSEYEAWFGCPVHFGADEAAALLDPAMLAEPMPTANPLFAEHFQVLTREALAALSSRRDTAARLRAALTEALAGYQLGEASLESAARALRTSPRSLQRALRREGTRFSRELEAVRRAEAERLLLAGVDIAEISWRLGYAEPPVFHRAFKRWTGQPPESWRSARSALRATH